MVNRGGGDNCTYKLVVYIHCFFSLELIGPKSVVINMQREWW
jgi:hypothetical protein